MHYGGFYGAGFNNRKKAGPKRQPGLKWQISGFTDRATMPNGKVGFGFSGPNCTINLDVEGNSNTPSEATLSTFQLVNLSTALRFFASLTAWTNPKRVLWGKWGGSKLWDLINYPGLNVYNR